MENRLLGRRWIASPERIEAETERYRDLTPTALRETYESAVATYDEDNHKWSSDKKELARARLAAMQQLLNIYKKNAERRQLTEKIVTRSVVKHYRAVYGSPPNPRIIEQITEFLRAGVGDKLICSAIDSAADKDKRWNYVKGILENCIKENKTSLSITPKSNSSFDLDAYERMLAENY